MNSGRFAPAHQVRLSLSRPSVVANFVTRQEEENQLHQAIASNVARTVLVGNAGCGKSQLAAKIFEHRDEQGWPLVAWISADSRNSVLSGLAEIGYHLGIIADPDQNSTLEELAKVCLDTLAAQKEEDRLVVLDNVEDFSDLGDAGDLIPQGLGLRVLVTTTQQAAWEESGFTRIPIKGFTRKQSIDYLTSQTGQNNREMAGAIAEKLADLPLALGQAVAYINFDATTPLSLEEYLEARSQHSLTYWAEQGASQIADYPRDIATALRMTAEKTLLRLANTSSDLADIARRQLAALSTLATSGVPRDWLHNLRSDVKEAKRALSALVESSVCQTIGEADVVTLHRLQAEALREPTKDGPILGSQEDLINAALAVLTSVNIDEFPRNDTVGRRRQTLALIHQLQAISEQSYSEGLFAQEAIVEHLSHVLYNAYDLGVPGEALVLAPAVELLEQILGPDHPDIVTSRDILAGAYRQAGRLKEAIDLYETNLHDQLRILGPDHPNTLLGRNNLATAYREAERLDEAVELYELNLEEHSRVLGSDHPDTAATKRALAEAYRLTGRTEEAQQLLGDSDDADDSPGNSMEADSENDDKPDVGSDDR